MNVILTSRSNGLAPSERNNETAYLVPVLRLSVPVCRVPRDIVYLDRARFSKLRRGRVIQVETDHPDPCPIEHLTLLSLRLWLYHRHLMEIQIRGNPATKMKIQE